MSQSFYIEATGESKYRWPLRSSALIGAGVTECKATGLNTTTESFCMKYLPNELK